MDDWEGAPLEDLEDGESFGAELLDSSVEFIGDVGRDPFGGAWPMGSGCND